ncbi:MAG: hypothetical protein NVSMB62_02970 [Acidobacteriaceae bacterium]
MSFPFRPADVQSQTLRAYTLLHALHLRYGPVAWPGALILNVSLDAPGTALSLAATIAGAICLTLEPDSARTRSALRANACDFVVNTLDEALRAIKNEIRQRRPLSVALQADPTQTLDQIVARGLAPQLFTRPGEYPMASAALTSLGTSLLEVHTADAAPAGKAPAGYETAEAVLEAVLAQPPWDGMSPQTVSFATAAELRAFDTHALSLLFAEDTLRHRWLTLAPRLFPRDRTRTLWMTPDESAQLAAARSQSELSTIEQRPSTDPKAT